MIDEQHAIATLRAIARTIGADVVVGDVPDGATVIGRPPANATLCRHRGRLLVVCDGLDSPAAVEEVVHELAHGSGLDDEWACFEREAVWALRFHASVSTAVAEAAATATPAW